MDENQNTIVLKSPAPFESLGVGMTFSLALFIIIFIDILINYHMRAKHMKIISRTKFKFTNDATLEYL